MVVEGRTGGDSNVIHVYANDSTLGSVFCDDLFIDLVHHCLKSGGGIAKAEKHDCGFKEAIACFEGRFVFVAFLDSHVVISPSYVQLGEYGRSPKVSKEVRDEGKGVLVADRVLVKTPVILHWP